jgi:hypothetical protein
MKILRYVILGLSLLVKSGILAQDEGGFNLSEFAKIKETLYDLSDEHNYALVGNFVQKYKQDKAVRSLMITAIDELLQDAQQLWIATFTSVIAGASAFYVLNMHKYALGVMLLIVAVVPHRSYRFALRPVHFFKHCMRLQKIRNQCHYKTFQIIKNNYCKGAYAHF